MNQGFFKNIEASKINTFADLVEYQAGRVVSLTLVQKEFLTMTLFAFSQGESISTHSSPGDAFVYLLDGEASITIGDVTHQVKAGESILMPANTPHGLQADKNFKMLLLVLFA
ncbi:MAG: cupin domain-containing protein [Sporomusaceae bacterium]|nr:cupin domain-containing protein [Sporomusaceae bacterium]